MVRNVTFFRHSHVVIENLSFSLNKGECVMLFGPNGSGKTTLLNLMAGLIRPHQGEIFIQGIRIHQDPLFAKRHIGFLPEHLPLYPELTVREYLQLISKIRIIPKSNSQEAVEETLEVLALKEIQHHLIGILSKGSKQRVGLAQAMLHNPSVLMLDEPTTGLDKEQTQGLLETLLEYKKKSAIILSTHHDSEMEALCNQMIQFTSKHKENKHYDLDHCAM
jgi:ABC-2 type transport system ATP-binding protein